MTMLTVPSTQNKSSLQEAAKKIDTISKAAMEAFASAESFEKELAVATAVQELRIALTPEVMAHVMALMNTSIGFDTDRNPAKWNSDKPFPGTYPMEVVRDVFIEARLRGFHVIGKEFCIISGNFYAQVSGLDRKVRQHEKVSNFVDTYEVPRTIGDKGALVKCKAEWNQLAEDNSRQKRTLEREFAIRVNAGQGADAILGKCKRKLMAAVYSLLSGVMIPDGEVGDAVVDVTGAAANSTPVTPKAESLFGKPGTEANGVSSNQTQTASEKTVPPVAPAPETNSKPATPQSELKINGAERKR